MVARCSVAEALTLLYSTDVSFFFLFFLSPHFLKRRKNRHPRNFPVRRGLVPNRSFAIFKVAPKINGPKNPKFAQFFVSRRRQLAP